MTQNILFLLAALLTVGGSISILFTRNIVHACMFLLGTLIGVAGLYASLGADFVAVTQIMVYVGGVVILMLFAIMLTGGKEFVSRAQQILQLAPGMGNIYTFIFGAVGAVVFVVTNVALLKGLFLEIEQKPMPYTETVNEIGNLLLTEHVLAFEISSVLLLGALVGAAIIARPRR